MHKSGTTLLSRILHESGIPMGEFDLSRGYDEGNKYERPEPRDFNIEILGRDPGDHSLDTSTVIGGPDRVPENLKAGIRAFLAETARRSPDWGFKDPRTCLTYAVWKELLPVHKILVVFRHPAELWTHYRKQRHRQMFRVFGICWKATYAWYVYNREVLNILGSTRLAVFCCEYGNFMSSDAIFERLCEFTGRRLNDRRKKELYRSKGSEDLLFRLTLWIHKRFFSRDLLGLYEELRRIPVTGAKGGAA